MTRKLTTQEVSERLLSVGTVYLGGYEGKDSCPRVKELWVKLVFGRFESWRCIWLV